LRISFFIRVSVVAVVEHIASQVDRYSLSFLWYGYWVMEKGTDEKEKKWQPKKGVFKR